MTALVAVVAQLCLILLKWLRDPNRKAARVESNMSTELKEIVNEVEVKDDARTEAELREILGG